MGEEPHSSSTPASVHGAQPEAKMYPPTPADDDEEPIEQLSPQSDFGSLFRSPSGTPQQVSILYADAIRP